MRIFWGLIMKNLSVGRVVGGTLIASIGAGAFGATLESTLHASRAENTVAVDIASSYIFRGETKNEDPVLQPSLGVDTDFGLSIGVWGNLVIDGNDTDQGNHFNDLDLSIGYTLPLPEGPVSVSVGATEYLTPSVAGKSEREVNLTIAGEVPLNPTLKVNYGVDGAIESDVYTELELSEEIFSNEDFRAGLGFTVAHIQPEDEAKQAGFHHALVSLSAGYQWVNLSANYFIETDKDVNSYKENEEFFATIGTDTAF